VQTDGMRASNNKNRSSDRGGSAKILKQGSARK
jgi:hypothetical protein